MTKRRSCTVAIRSVMRSTVSGKAFAEQLAQALRTARLELAMMVNSWA